MGLLDELKQQAESLREAEEAKQRSAEERAAEVRAQLGPALAQIHRYLVELIEPLKVLKPDIVVDFPLPGSGMLRGLRQGEYEVVAGGSPLESVVVRYTLRNDRRAEFELKGIASLETWLENLKRQGLEVHSARLTDGTATGLRAQVAIEGFVPVGLRFKMDLENGVLLLIVRNYDDLVDRRHVIRPEQVDGEFLEELGKYILRKPNRFLRREVPTEVRERLRKRLEEDKRQKEAEVGDSGAIGQRLKSLFKRRPQLTLRYQGQSKELSAFASGFTLGRGSTCDMQVNDRHVSRVHARIEVRDEQFVLVDESTNGTYVRQPDGSIVRLKGRSLVLEGEGAIALGSQPSDDNEHLIRFSC